MFKIVTSFFSLIVGMLSIQFGASLAKGLFFALGPLTTTMLRNTFAALILIAFWRPWRKRLKKGSYRNMVIYGVYLGVMNLTFYLALLRIPLGLAVALEFVGPLAVSVYSSRRKLDLLWILLAAVGIVLILPLKTDVHALDPWGVTYALVAGACWGGYIIYGKKAGSSWHSGAVTALGMGVAALTTMPFGLFSGELSHITPQYLLAGLGIAFLASVVPYSIEMLFLKKLPTHTFGILMSMEPAIAALAGLFVLHEKLLSIQWLAIAFIMVASAGTAAGNKTISPEDFSAQPQ